MEKEKKEKKESKEEKERASKEDSTYDDGYGTLGGGPAPLD